MEPQQTTTNTADGIEDRIKVLFQEGLSGSVPPPEADSLLHDSGATSLQSVMFVSKIEKTFGIEVSMRDYYGMTRLSELTSYIRDHTNDA